MPDWEVATALAIALIVALTTHVFYRRPPAALWPWLPLSFASALVFSVGDLIANLWAEDDSLRWVGMVILYTGLLGIASAWWGFSHRFAQIYGYARFPSGFGLRSLIVINSLLWVGLVTNPWHGEFLAGTYPGGRSTYGPLWVVTACLNYTVMFASLWMHVRGSITSADRVIRSQCRFLVAAITIPLVLNMTYILSPEPLSYDPTALGFALCCVLFLYAVERRDLFVLERVSLPGVLDQDADAVIIVSTDLRVLFSNPAASRLFAEGQLAPGIALDGLMAEALPSFSLTEALDPPRGEPGPEHRFHSPTGEELWIVVDVSPVYRGRGALAGLCLRLRDRTPLRRAHDIAAERAAVLDAVVHGSGEGLLVQSSSGEIRYVNQAFAALWGASREMVYAWGTEALEQVGRQLREQPRREFSRAWHRRPDDFDRNFEDTQDLLLEDGRIVEAQTFPIDASHGIDGRVWRFVDVTRRRRDLQAMIQSQKLEGLGVLAGGIAHDFNNLLVAILANAELAQQEVAEDASAHALLSDVQSAAVRASELTGQLLAYAGKTSFHREDLDLSRLVREVAELLMVSIPKGVEVDFRLSPGLPLVRAGSAEIRQIVMNLVTNAADSIGDDIGTIRIETGRGEPPPTSLAESFAEHGAIPNEVVFLRVMDSGTGMDRRTLERIFDPFFTTKFTGRGLGLASTLGILDGHGGALRIETALGTGSAFTVLLPMHQPVEPVVVQNEPGEHSSVCFEGRSVLVVDDEQSVRSVLAKVLGGRGLDVHQVGSGEEALLELNDPERIPDLVILDLTMPGIGGLETLDRIRVRCPRLPVLLSSGYPEEALRVIREKASPWNAFIQKPYRHTNLFEEIEKLLDAATESRNPVGSMASDPTSESPKARVSPSPGD
ncbi:response regulator [Myxococcota bacterium]|nr:response regulator [Myxococcota bacterium]